MEERQRPAFYDWQSVLISFFISLFRSPLASTAVVANPPGVHIQGAQNSVKVKENKQNERNKNRPGSPFGSMWSKFE